MLHLLVTAALAQAPVATVTTTTDDIVVDGVFDEPAWGDAEVIDTFLRFQPTDGGPPPGRTEVRFLQDDRYLYAAVVISGADYTIRARVSAREDINADDQVGIYFDTFLDQRSGYIFYLNALGIQQDLRRNGNTVSFRWDAVFKSEGRVTDDGYVLEVAWPWRSLRYADGSDEWGLILTRKIPHANEKYGFPTVVRNHPQLFSQAAVLRGVAPAPRGTGLELLPQLTLLQTATRDPQTDAMSWPGVSEPLTAVRPSLDARLGISPNMGLAATVNPDFSQVESDVTPVSLNQRFAFSFEERRPFFLEGSEYFGDPTASLYTRSINDPYGGLKIAGREGPWQIGALTATDRAPAASFHEHGAPGFTGAEGDVAQSTYARAARDVGATGSVGLTFADKRTFRDGDALGTHQLGLVDASLPVADRWVVSGARIQSFTGLVGGPPLVGNETWFQINRSAGVGTGFNLNVIDRSPGVRKETGFMNQSGFTDVSLYLNHTLEPDGPVDTFAPDTRLYWFEERSGDRSRGVRVGEELVGGGVHGSWTSVYVGDRRERGVTVGEWWAGGGAWTQVGRTLELYGESVVGRELDFRNLVPANAVSGEINATVRPTAGIRWDLSSRIQRFRPEGFEPVLAGRVRSRVQWQFTKPLGLRLVNEFNRGTQRDPTPLSSVLVTWLEHPGTAVWVGYSEITELSGRPKASARAVFAKVSVLIRP